MSLPPSESTRPCVVPISVADFCAGGRDTRGEIVTTPGGQYSLLGIQKVGPGGHLVVKNNGNWPMIMEIMRGYALHLGTYPGRATQEDAYYAYCDMIMWEISYELETGWCV